MKLKLFSILFILSCKIYATQNRNLQKSGGAEIKFEEPAHSFGVLNKGEKCEYKFKFTNVGSEPLIISYTNTSCGCAVANWPKEPIMPGQSNEIIYTYDSKRVGAFVKTGTVFSNAKNSTIILKVCGMVIEPGISAQSMVNVDQYCNCTSQKTTNKETPINKSDSVIMSTIPVINIFPNPFETQATIQFNKILNGANAILYNMVGQQVKEIKNIFGSSFTLQRDNLPSGIYFISLMQDNRLITTKRIVITE